MESNEQDGGIVDTETTNEDEGHTEVESSTEEKPKRTPQEELEYFEGRAARLRKKLGINEQKPTVSEEVAHDSSKPNDLDYGEKAYLRSALDLKGADELQLAKEFKGKYGMSVEEMESDSLFMSKLSGLREARESTAAIPKGTKRAGQTGVTDVDIAVAKYRDSGELPQDFKTRTAVVNKMVEDSKNDGIFTGPSVVGPAKQSY